MNNEKRIDRLTKQFPILARAPRNDRLAVHRQAVRSPWVWIVLVGMMGGWLYLFADDIMAIEIPSGLRGRERMAAIFTASFFPAILPIMVMCATLFLVVYQRLRYILHRRYGNR